MLTLIALLAFALCPVQDIYARPSAAFLSIWYRRLVAFPGPTVVPLSSELCMTALVLDLLGISFARYRDIYHLWQHLCYRVEFVRGYDRDSTLCPETDSSCLRCCCSSIQSILSFSAIRSSTSLYTRFRSINCVHLRPYV